MQSTVKEIYNSDILFFRENQRKNDNTKQWCISHGASLTLKLVISFLPTNDGLFCTFLFFRPIKPIISSEQTFKSEEKSKILREKKLSPKGRQKYDV